MRYFDSIFRYKILKSIYIYICAIRIFILSLSLSVSSKSPFERFESIESFMMLRRIEAITIRVHTKRNIRGARWILYIELISRDGIRRLCVFVPTIDLRVSMKKKYILNECGWHSLQSILFYVFELSFVSSKCSNRTLQSVGKSYRVTKDNRMKKINK